MILQNEKKIIFSLKFTLNILLFLFLNKGAFYILFKVKEINVESRYIRFIYTMFYLYKKMKVK